MGDEGVLMRKKLIISIYIALGVIVVSGICVGLVLGGRAWDEAKRHEEYAVVQEWVQKTSSGRGAVENFLQTEVKSIELNNEEKLAIENFERAILDSSEVQNILQKLKDAADDGEIKKISEEAALSYIDLRALYLVEKDISVMYDGELNDQDLEQLSRSENEYLVNLAKDIDDYRSRVKKLNIKDKDFEKEHKALLEEGEKLGMKYTKIKLEDLIGKKREEVLLFYDKLDELNKLLEKRKE